MVDRHKSRPPPQSPQATGDAPARPAPDAAGSASGRVVHDDRGRAVWDWIKVTGRIAIESTSRLLKKLEAPELEVEDRKDQYLRLESDRDPGGGYDPYNQARRPDRKR